MTPLVSPLPLIPHLATETPPPISDVSRLHTSLTERGCKVGDCLGGRHSPGPRYPPLTPAPPPSSHVGRLKDSKTTTSPCLNVFHPYSGTVFTPRTEFMSMPMSSRGRLPLFVRGSTSPSLRLSTDPVPRTINPKRNDRLLTSTKTG